jgi:hypothetical protein
MNSVSESGFYFSSDTVKSCKEVPILLGSKSPHLSVLERDKVRHSTYLNIPPTPLHDSCMPGNNYCSCQRRLCHLHFLVGIREPAWGVK